MMLGLPTRAIRCTGATSLVVRRRGASTAAELERQKKKEEAETQLNAFDRMATAELPKDFDFTLQRLAILGTSQN
jgi:hypothetical protein